jgi:hypothetical protein
VIDDGDTGSEFRRDFGPLEHRLRVQFYSRLPGGSGVEGFFIEASDSHSPIILKLFSA